MLASFCMSVSPLENVSKLSYCFKQNNRNMHDMQTRARLEQEHNEVMENQAALQRFKDERNQAR